jgi:arylsulfatase A-like enzyme
MDRAEFQGVIGRSFEDSTPWWPDEPRPPAGAPNIVLVVLDDVGFAQLGCFGSDIDTPALDRVAADGLRYSNFHTTALCSPTRACLLTGRNHHSNGMGRITDLAMGFPGYDARIPPSNSMLPKMLVPHGYAAYAVGKWHLTPEEEWHAGAPRERWPLSRGFQRWYGFFGGETHQFAPELVYDSHHIDPPRSMADGYHLTEDLADRALEFVHDLRATDAAKPFFLYFATGACHSPHQSPQEWRDRYRGNFDAGWDAWREATLARQVEAGVLEPATELSPRPDWVPAWDSLSADTRRVYARYMEAFAAFLSHADHQIGRMLDGLRATGDLDNTLLLVCSDNGASSEGGPVGSLNDGRAWNVVPRTVDEALARIDEIGGPRIHNNYPWGWTVAGNTPFRRWKREVHEGGVADPLLVSWPARIAARGEMRRQFVHVIDVLPTVLEAIGIEPPAVVDGVEQRPIEGTSFAYTFDAPEASERHQTQYFEMLGCRALYDRGWKAVTYHDIQFCDHTFDEDHWELYDLRSDPSECHDLSGTQREKLMELIDKWWQEADKYQVLPLDNRAFSEFVIERPAGIADQDHYTYWPDGGMVPEMSAVNVRNRSHEITAAVEIPAGGAEGVLLAMGSVLGGFTFFVQDGELRYVHNLCGYEQHRITAPISLAPGEHTLTFRFTKTAEHAGTGTLLVDGEVVGEGELPKFTPMRFSITCGGLRCGRDGGAAVADDYTGPFPFTGTIHQVVVDVTGRPHIEQQAELEQAVASQ